MQTSGLSFLKKISNMLLTIILNPNRLVTCHVVSAQKRGLPGQGEISEVPTFYLSLNVMSQTQPVAVRIYNRTYHLVNSEGQDPEYIRLAAAYLDEKMQQIAAASGARGPLDIAILAALNIAEEVLDARQHKDALIDGADARIDSFTQLLSDDSPATESSSTDAKRF